MNSAYLYLPWSTCMPRHLLDVINTNLEISILSATPKRNFSLGSDHVESYTDGKYRPRIELLLPIT